MSQRIVVYHNPKSSTHSKYTTSVHRPLAKLARSNQKISIIEITVDKPFEKTVDFVAKTVQDDDIVFAAGGDGTVSAIMNGCLKSGRDITFGVLGLGRGNDAAATINGRMINPVKIMACKTVSIYPLDFKVNGRHNRYALQHIALGVAAEASDILNNQSRGKGLFSNSVPAGVREVARLILDKQKNAEALFPAHERNDKSSKANASVIANGRIAKIITPKVDGKRAKTSHKEPGKFYAINEFVTGSSADISTAASWVIGGMPCQITERETYKFNRPESILAAVDGEVFRVDASKLDVTKSKRSIRVFAPALTKSTRAKPARP